MFKKILLMVIIAVAVTVQAVKDRAIWKMQVKEQLKDVWSVMKGMMEFIIYCKDKYENSVY